MRNIIEKMERIFYFRSINNIVSYSVDVFIVIFVPFLLVLLNQDWTYAKWYTLDEWIYVGYGYNYLDPTFYATSYKLSRLPWVLAEALVRGSFSPLSASWILTLGVLALGNIALYFALRIPFGRLPALLAGIFMSGLTFMQANGGADYHNTLAGAFYCWSMLLCSKCSERFNPRNLAFFGVSLGLTVHTNPLFINLSAILLAQYFISYRIKWSEFPPFVATTLLVAFGVAAVTILLGFINYCVGRQFLFFAEQLRLVSNFIADSSLQRPWWLPWSSHWFLNYPYMGLIFAGALLSIRTLVVAVPRRFKSAHYAYATVYSTAYILALLIWVFWQSIGQTALQPFWFVFPLGFPLIGALAAAIATVVPQEVRPVPLTVFALGFAITIAAGVHEAIPINDFVGGLSWPLALRLAIAFALAFAMISLLQWSLWTAPLVALALCIANALAVFDPATDRAADYAATDCRMRRDAYELILDASARLRNTHFPHSRIFLFSDEGEKLGLGPGCGGLRAPLPWLHTAIAANGDFQNVAPAWSKKTLETVEPERWQQMIKSKGIIGFLTYDPQRISALQDKVKAAGGSPGAVDLFRLRAGDIELPLYILQFTQ
jgi:hypothetical protein